MAATCIKILSAVALRRYHAYKDSNFNGEFFSFVLRDVVNLSTTLFIQRFFTFFIFFIKNALFNVFYSWGQRFLHLWVCVGVCVCNCISLSRTLVSLLPGL